MRALNIKTKLLYGCICRREGDNKGWDGWMASLTWTWVWASSGSWWWTGKRGVLQSTGSQRVRHNWATELIWCNSIPWWVRWWRICLQCRNVASIPWSGKPPGEGNGYPLHYSCLENSMDRGAWWAMAHRVSKSQTWLKWLSTHYKLHADFPLLRGLAVYVAQQSTKHLSYSKAYFILFNFWDLFGLILIAPVNSF